MSTNQNNPWAGLLPAPDTPANSIDPMDALASMLVSLESGLPVPSRIAAHWLQALRPCLAGDNAIAARLGLSAGTRGKAHTAPARRTHKLHRDALIAAAVRAMQERRPGPVGHCALALHALWSYGNACPGARVSESIDALAAHHGPALSERHILRVLKKEMAYHQAASNAMK